MSAPVSMEQRGAVYPPLGTPSRYQRPSDAADRRRFGRTPMRSDLWLVDIASQTLLRCQTTNVSRSGIHAIAPSRWPVRVGTRMELRMVFSEPRAVDLPHTGGYATVIRTELYTDERGVHQGLALKLDEPLGRDLD